MAAKELRLLVRRAGEHEPSLLLFDLVRGWEAFQAAALDTLHLDARTHTVTAVDLSAGGNRLCFIKAEDLWKLRENDLLDITTTMRTIGAPTAAPPATSAALVTPGVQRAAAEAGAPRRERGAVAGATEAQCTPEPPSPARHGDAAASIGAAAGDVNPFRTDTLKHVCWRALQQAPSHTLSAARLVEVVRPWYSFKEGVRLARRNRRAR
jgi:hypothetical protein